MTTIEGGMISTNNYDLYKLFLLKRNHGMAFSLPEEDYDLESKKYPNLSSRFLFLTTGYNFRNTEINAVLGLSQLSKLDSFIENRNMIYREYIKICKENSDIIYVMNDFGVSSFALPFIFKKDNYIKKFIDKLEENLIEYRPIVGGNLLEQPFLEKYKGQKKNMVNSQIIQSRGLYIGNNQFVEVEQLDKISKVLSEIR